MSILSPHLFTKHMRSFPKFMGGVMVGFLILLELLLISPLFESFKLATVDFITHLDPYRVATCFLFPIRIKTALKVTKQSYMPKMKPPLFQVPVLSKEPDFSNKSIKPLLKAHLLPCIAGISALGISLVSFSSLSRR